MGSGCTKDGSKSQSHFNKVPKPPKLKKKELVKDIAKFSEVDNHALKAPDGLRSNIEELVAYLVEPAKDNLERVRAFYRWITHNISYDTESVITGSVIDTNPEVVLRAGTSVSGGYSNLFKSFCKLVDIPATTICGFGKGFGWLPGTILSTDAETDHAWNAVFLSGDWRLIECTWGAGFIDKNGNFCWSYKEFYFMTNPEEFIVDHFPYLKDNADASSPWQMLASPLTLDQFSKSLRLKSVAIENGLCPISHPLEFITLKKDEIIRISYPVNNFISFLGYLRTEDSQNVDEYIMMEIEKDDSLVIHHQLPDEETYYLDLYGSLRGDESEQYDILLTYKMKGCGDIQNPKKYPKYQRVIGPCWDYRRYGFTEQVAEKVSHLVTGSEATITLKVGKKVEVLVKLEHAEKELPNPKMYCYVRNENSFIDIDLRLPLEGYYKLTICAQRPWTGNKHFWDVITYLIECTSPDVRCSSFPVQYTKTQHLNLRVLEPRSGHISAQTETNFYIVAPCLQRVIVHDTLLQKEGDEFQGMVQVPEVGDEFIIYGSAEQKGSFDSLFKYEIVPVGWADRITRAET